MSSNAQSENISNFQIRPDLKDKFRSSVVKDLIHSVISEKLTGFVYSAEASEVMARTLSESIIDKLSELKLPRYKFVVNVVLGEQRGAGVKVSGRCLWDADSDNYASDVFLAICARTHHPLSQAKEIADIQAGLLSLCLHLSHA